jgi:hypothetical protein
MKNRTVKESLRYKDRGQVQYTIIEGFDSEQDCLELKYSDAEKVYSWDYYFTEDGKSALEHIENVSYEELKIGFVDFIHRDGYYLHKHEYKLLKEAIVIFVSHKKYIIDVCQKNGLC